jgi:hypothetical protein
MSSNEELARAIADLRERVRILEGLEVPTYATGVWTPAYKGETTAGTTGHTTQYGIYSRIGRAIIAIGYVVWSSATGTGNANITLPFTAANNGNQIPPVTLFTDGVTFASGSPQGAVIPNTSYFRIYYPANNASTTIIPVEAAGQVAFTATYFV